MIDEMINRQWTGRCKSNAKGSIVELCFEESKPLGGSAFLISSVSLEVISLKEASMEALQTFRATNGWSAYAFEKQ